MSSRPRPVTATIPLDADDARFVAAARLRASRLQPYLAAAVYALVPVSQPGLGTFAVDGHWRLYLDMEQAREWGVEASAAVLLHEAHHVLRDHNGRARRAGVNGAHQNYLWNLAGDAAINDDLRADGAPLPDGGVYPRHLGAPDNLLEEAYYRLLLDGDSDALDPDPKCGSGAGGETLDCEPPDPDDPPDGMPDGLDDIDAGAIRRAVAHDVKAAAAAAQKSGPSPRLVVWADQLLRPQVPWQQLLRSALRRELRAAVGAPVPTYARPDRRAEAWPHVIRPGAHRRTANVAVVIDTSGSMEPPLINAAVTEIDSLLHLAGVRELPVLVCDHEVTTPQVVRHISALRLTGGGGTDLRVGIDAAAALHPRPSVVAVVTDGFTPWPCAAPRGMVIIAVVIGDEAPLPSGPGIVAIRVEEPR